MCGMESGIKFTILNISANEGASMLIFSMLNIYIPKAFSRKSFRGPLLTLDPQSFDYSFLATLDERGQGIPNDGDKRGGKGLPL